MRTLLYLGALLLSVLLAIGLNWALEHYRERPEPAIDFDDPRLSFRPAKHLARAAVRNFRQLPVEEQQILRAELVATTSTLEQWVRSEVDGASVLCLGERHEDDVRRFVARRILPVLKLDVLMLETSGVQLQLMRSQHRQGIAVSLLGATFSDVLRAVDSRVPRAHLVAIDEYQASRSGEHDSSQNEPVTLRDREDAVVGQLLANWDPGKRHTVLFGALHCRSVPGWMLHKLEQRAPEIREQGILGAVILARYREPGAQVLMYMLDELGFDTSVVVVPRIGRFPKQIQQWLPPTADAMAGYDSAIFFDDRAQSR